MLHLICIFVITLLENVNFVYTNTNQSIKNESILPNISRKLEPRILHGYPADIGEYPWVTYIEYQKGKGIFYGGGSIISNRHVLTAGHCCRGEILEPIRVRVSELDLDTNPDCEWAFLHLQMFGYGCDSYIREYRAEKVTEFKPFYLPTFPSGDICIIRVSEDIAFSEYVKPINLPFGNGVDFSEQSFSGQELSTVGWGSLNEGMGNRGSFLLMETNLKVVDKTECINKWTNSFPLSARNMGHEHICAGSSRESTICRGDSGGPLMFVHEGKTYIIGIASATIFCVPFNPIDVPAVFMRVDRFKNWIQENMQ